MRRLAAYVDEKMGLPAESTPADDDSLRLAVLAALNIADELFRAPRDDPGARTAQVAERRRESSNACSDRVLLASEPLAPDTVERLRFTQRFEFPALLVMAEARLSQRFT